MPQVRQLNQNMPVQSSVLRDPAKIRKIKQGLSLVAVLLIAGFFPLSRLDRDSACGDRGVFRLKYIGDCDGLFCLFILFHRLNRIENQTTDLFYFVFGRHIILGCL